MASIYKEMTLISVFHSFVMSTSIVIYNIELSCLAKGVFSSFNRVGNVKILVHFYSLP